MQTANLQIVMQYTGWPKQISQCAIRQWQQKEPGWNAQYILAYLNRLLQKERNDSKARVE